MHDVHQAVEALCEITGLPGLALGQDGHTEVVFNETVPVGFVRIDDHHLEFVTPLPGVVSALDLPTLTRLMGANYLGAATGAARLALDPGRGAVALCERVDVRVLDRDGFQDRVIGFLASAAFWTGEEGRAALGAAPQAEDLPSTDQYIIRG